MLRLGLVAFVGGAAIWDDLTRRRISNWICVAALTGGFAVQCFESGWKGAWSALLGMITGAAIFLVFYLLGGMGGGDIKLMAGFGAVLGVRGIVEASFWTAACGGLLAAGLLLTRAVRSRRSVTGAPASEVESMPYAPAIAAGALLSLASRG